MKIRHWLWVFIIILGIANIILFVNPDILAINISAKNKSDFLTPQAKELSALGGDFVVQTINGDYDLAKARGKLVLFYFGYTFCPDICPTNLGNISIALKQLSNQELKNIDVLFISVDPNRDKLDSLDSYAKFYHPKIIGATSTAENLSAITNKYGAYYKIHPPKDNASYYVVDHTSITFLVNREGKLANIFPHDTAGDKIVDAIRAELTKK